MAKIFPFCTVSVEDHLYGRRDYERFLHYAKMDEVGRHRLVENVDDADVVLFVGSAKPNFSDITNSPIYLANRRKAIIYFSGDRSIPFIPGVYTCLEEPVFGVPPYSALGGYYLRVTDNDSLEVSERVANATFLYSFVGNVTTHPVRSSILRIVDDRAYLRDSSLDSQQQADGIHGSNSERGLHYRDVIAKSKFVLCPRGIGVASWRLFEVMRAGRVPVIIADDWVPPSGLDWASFSLRVREKHIPRLPEILRSHESMAETWGIKARAVWLNYYSSTRVADTIMEDANRVLIGVRTKTLPSRFLLSLQYAKPFFIRHWLLAPLKSQIRKLLNW